MSPEIVEQTDADELPPLPPAKKSKKKLLILGVGALVLLGGGGGAGYMLMPRGGAAHGEAAPAKEAAHVADPESFVDVPAMVVNLRSPDGAARFLKVHFMLVPGSKSNAEELKAKLPMLLDAYQPFLRELRPEDLAGSAAVFRIKEELLRRAVEALGADMVDDILIQDLIQQ